MRKTFTAQDQYVEFIAMRHSVSIGVTIEAGTNSLSINEYINGVAYAVGAAITTTGTRRHLANGVDYTAPARIRVAIPTFQTGPVHVDIEGDYISEFDGSMSVDGGAFIRVTDAGEQRITDDGEIRVLENG